MINKTWLHFGNGPTINYDTTQHRIIGNAARYMQRTHRTPNTKSWRSLSCFAGQTRVSILKNVDRQQHRGVVPFSNWRMDVAPDMVFLMGSAKRGSHVELERHSLTLHCPFWAVLVQCPPNAPLYRITSHPLPQTKNGSSATCERCSNISSWSDSHIFGRERPPPPFG